MRDVAARLDGKCALQLGFTVSDFTRFFDELAFGTEEQMERIRNSARRWLSAANSERCLQYFAEDNPGLSNHPFLTGISAEAASHEATQARLWHITEDLFRSIFIVDRPDGDKDSRALCLFRALSERALRFGDISEDQIPSLHLANPVRLAPIIIGPAGEHYIFCTISAVAGQVEIFENILTDYPSLEASYRDFKARWLERMRWTPQ